MQTVYICVGVPGSGKSTHSKTLELVTNFLPKKDEQVVRVNQDSLGNRGACLNLASMSLRAGQSVIIDRCNVSQSQRSPWINLAKQYGCRVVVEHFKVPEEVCLARAYAREDHETMTDPATYRAIIAGFRTTWQTPVFDEGIDEIRERDARGNIVNTFLPQQIKEKTSILALLKKLWRAFR